MRPRQGIGSLDVEDEVEREVRRREADWGFIESLPPKLRASLKLFIETGDLRLAQRLAQLDLEDLLDLLSKARVPAFITVRPPEHGGR